MVWLLNCALKITLAIGSIVGVAAFLFLGVGLIAGLVGGIVGIWDGLVWLLKADWRTTHFQWFWWAAIVCVPSLILGWLLTLLHVNLEEVSEDLEEVIKKKKELAAGQRAP